MFIDQALHICENMTILTGIYCNIMDLNTNTYFKKPYVSNCALRDTGCISSKWDGSLIYECPHGLNFIKRCRKHCKDFSKTSFNISSGIQNSTRSKNLFFPYPVNKKMSRRTIVEQILKHEKPGKAAFSCGGGIMWGCEKHNYTVADFMTMPDAGAKFLVDMFRDMKSDFIFVGSSICFVPFTAMGGEANYNLASAELTKKPASY